MICYSLSATGPLPLPFGLADPRPTRSDGIEDLLCVNHVCESRLQPHSYPFVIIYLSFRCCLQRWD